jgi:hypothetical protein
MAGVHRVLLAAAALGLAAACAEPTGFPPDDVELLPANLSLDPARVRVGETIATPCERHAPDGFAALRDRHEWGLVDITFGRAGEGPTGPPSRAELELVRRHGGNVVHEYRIPAVRARMVLSRIPGLVREGFWVLVRDVPDQTRYDVPLMIGFGRALTDADAAVFAERGGLLRHRFESLAILGGILPDRSIPPYQADPAVRYVEADHVACLGGGIEQGD